MKKHMLAGGTLALLISALFFVAARPAHAITIADLQAQIQALVQKIAQLQGQSGSSASANAIGATAPMRVCALLQRNLSQGMSGDDVASLQEYLKTQGFFSSEATGYFGPITARAVAQWQSQQGVSSVGAFGPLSRARLKLLCNPQQNDKLSAAPTFGAAPLDVSFTANVDVLDPMKVADGSSYKIDFGDGTEYVFACSASGSAWMCPGPQRATHTYAQSGTYTASLINFGGFGGPAISSKVAQVTITVGASACRPITYMPIACGDGSAAQAVQDQNGCVTGYVCPVANFVPPSNCKAWNDGCNSCSKQSPDAPAMCTLRACFAAGKGYCSAYFDSTTGNKPPVVSGFSGPTSLTLNEVGSWSIKASDPENGDLQYSIQWGDEWYAGSGAAMSSASPSIVQTTTFTHSYSSPGTYTIWVTVTDEHGAQAQTSTTVTVGGNLVACTLEYAPVCAQPPEPACRHTLPACMMATPGPTTYGNRCMMNAAGATFLYEGACATTY